MTLNLRMWHPKMLYELAGGSMLFARVRSEERDKNSDLDRFQMVSQAVRAALASLEKERLGLSTRVERIQQQLGPMYGNQDGYYEAREPAQEIALAEVERNMMRASERLSNIEAQVSLFRNLERQVLIMAEESGFKLGE